MSDAPVPDGSTSVTSPPRDARSTVEAWARAWSDQAADRYLAFYSVAFQPENLPSRSTWEAQRRERIARPKSIRVRLENIRVTVFRDRTEVVFDQHYESDRFADRVRKKLVLVWEDDRFKIRSESAVASTD